MSTPTCEVLVRVSTTKFEACTAPVAARVEEQLQDGRIIPIGYCTDHAPKAGA